MGFVLFGMRKLLPFLISLVGVVADNLTTRIGLGLGFYESHPLYQPVYALVVFWGISALRTLTLPKGKFSELTKGAVASMAFLGFVNNTLVIFGIFRGLRI